MGDQRPRLTIVVGVAIAVASLMMGSVVAGWAAANRLIVATQQSVEQEVVTVALPDYLPGSVAQMPDVRGLTVDDARLVLAESGLPASLVTVDEAPSAGPPGVVVAQTPVFGTVNPSLARLIVSTPAQVPVVAGREPGAVVAELQSLGARVVQTRVFVPGATVGTVVSVEPAPGTALPSQISIVIADSPVARSLSELDRISGSASTRQDVVHLGVAYPLAVYLSSSRTAASTSWNLGAEASVVNGSIAAADPPASGFEADVRVIADGVEIASYTVSGSTPTAFSWSVVGVSTLTVSVTRTGTSSGSIVLLAPEALGSYSGSTTR